MFNALPTVELHRHFEAGLRPEMIAKLAEKNGITKVRTRAGVVLDEVDPQSPASIQAYYTRVGNGFKGPGGFARFIDSFGVPLQVLCTLEDLQQAAFDQVVYLHEQGSLHTELRGSPFSYQERIDAPIEEILGALMAGAQQAFDEHEASATFIAAFSRQKGLSGAPHQPATHQAPYIAAAAATLHSEERPLGVDIAGFPEDIYPPRLFAEALAPAREACVPLTIHCGEQGAPPDFSASPPELIVEAIEVLGARRIGHGTSLMASASARSLVKERAVGIECCPVSNQIMGFVERLEDHPLRSFLDEGLLASIATDDPLMFGDFTNRSLLQRVQKAQGLDEARLLKLASNGIESAFVSDERRHWLRKTLENSITSASGSVSSE
ncbi:MAG: hypothetical protein GY822_22130 [Deltaproteobacteria bacterium]|nr:hypothetical protein [Deltaproteobacteria bacterium]